MKRHSVTVLLDELSLFFIDQAVHLAMAQSAKNGFLFITFMGNSVFLYLNHDTRCFRGCLLLPSDSQQPLIYTQTSCWCANCTAWQLICPCFWWALFLGWWNMVFGVLGLPKALLCFWQRYCRFCNCHFNHRKSTVYLTSVQNFRDHIFLYKNHPVQTDFQLLQ